MMVYLPSFIFFALTLFSHGCIGHSLKGHRELKHRCPFGSEKFFYETMIGITSYPVVHCSNKENKDISVTLQETMNKVLSSKSTRYRSKNKVCSSPLGNRRLDEKRGVFSSNETSFDQRHRQLHGRYLYLAGGRCHFCLFDNSDKRVRHQRRTVEDTTLEGLVQLISDSKTGKKCLGIKGAAMSKWAPLEQQKCSDVATYQKFEFVENDDQTYLIKAEHSGLCLTISKNAKMDGFAIEQRRCSKNISNKWIIEKIDGRLILESAHSKKCMQIMPNHEVKQWTCDRRSSNQLFSIGKSPKPMVEVEGFMKISVPSDDEPMCLGIKGASMKNLEKMTEQTCSNLAKHQQFEFVKNDDETYHIKPQHSGLCLTISKSMQDGFVIEQTGCNQNPSEKWRVEKEGNKMMIKSVHSKKCMQIMPDQTLQQWACDPNSNSQLLSIINALSSHVEPPEGLVKFYSASDTKCLGIKNSSLSRWAKFTQQDCYTNAEHQKFEFVEIIDGAYLIKAKHSGKCITMSQKVKTNGAFLEQTRCNDKDTSYKWVIEKVNGGEIVKSLHSHKCMQVMPNQELEQWTCDPNNKDQLLSVLSDGMSPPPSVSTKVPEDSCKHNWKAISKEEFNSTSVSLWEDGRHGKGSQNISDFLGPYSPGDQPRRVLQIPEGADGVGISFIFYEFDTIQSNSSLYDNITGAFGDNGDDPLFVLVNNVQLDFKQLVENIGDMNEKHVLSNFNGYPAVGGTTIAGIEWFTVKLKEGNYLFKSGVDRATQVIIAGAPRILFDHTHRLDLRFILKKEGKAASYGFGNVTVMASSFDREECNKKQNLRDEFVEWTPWENFRGKVEPMLQDDLRKALISKYYNTAGHCLQNIKPIISINMVQKPEWSQAKPRCD